MTKEKSKSRCGICCKNVLYNQKSLHCSKCLHCIRIKCSATLLSEYEKIIQAREQNPGNTGNELWNCPKCNILQNAEMFPFGLESTYDLHNINMSNSMKTVEMIPEFETNSEILKVNNLCSNDIDENLVNKINCKYFNNEEFSKLSTKENSLNIFHANVNGLECHFEDLHHFLSESHLDFNAICISETSQLNDTNFDNNVDYSIFTTETLTAKGGVAIYIKDNLETVEREELKIKCLEYETVWIEIKNKKGKNIAIGCIYRHPHMSNMDDFNQYMDKINKENKEVYLAGDFNIDLSMTLYLNIKTSTH